jgi:uncharacterized membrane protein YdfJ with MMPL/SSD domain
MSFSLGTMAVVRAAMVASLTVLPALLSRLGDHVDRGRVPFLWRRLARLDGRGWGAFVRVVLRRPALSATISTAALVALALPALHLHTAQSGLATLPAGTPEIRTLKAFEASVPGGADPARIVVKAPDIDAEPVRAGLRAWRAKPSPPASPTAARPPPLTPRTPSPRSSWHWSATAPTPRRSAR